MGPLASIGWLGLVQCIRNPTEPKDSKTAFLLSALRLHAVRFLRFYESPALY